MNKLVRIMERIVSVIETAGWAAGGLGLLFIVGSVTVYIFVRFLFKVSWQFVYEWSEYFLVLMIYMGLAYTLRSRGHIRVDMAVKQLQPRVRQVIELVVSFVAFFVIIGLIVWQVETVIKDWSLGVTSTYQSRFPIWIPNLFVAAGLVTFGMEMLRHLIRVVSAAARGVFDEEELR